MTKKFIREGFWNKLSNYALDAGKDVVRSGLKLYFAAVGKNMPVWEKWGPACIIALFGERR